jgi:uncharacterized protein YdeI (YjbR/CyaY-like superfamily)
MKAFPSEKPELTIRLFATPAAWADWLETHHESAPGLWLQLARKDSGVASVTYQEALDVALCYGWIDGQKKGYDETTWLQKFTPRGRKSLWSKVNCQKVEVLLAQGSMQPAGLRAVEAARADGRWEAAYDSQSKATVPEDFQTALDASPAAKEFFATLNSANRYAVLFRIQTAKRAETRAARIKQFIGMLERGEKIHA